jgi:molybdate transport system substrate-binding protein
MKIQSIVLALILISSCRNADRVPHSELLAAVAANVADTISEAGSAFEAKSGIHVTISAGATGALAKQIENGAPFDLFISADVETVDRLIAEGRLIPTTRRVYARGRLVLWSRPDSPVKLSSLEEIAQDRIQKIAVANPEIAPYGKAAMEALASSGLLDRIRQKLVYGESINQVYQFAQTGNVEAAFLPLSMTRRSTGNYFEIDEKLYKPIDQALAVVSSSQAQTSAIQFVDFITGPAGRVILEQFGYTIIQAK